MVTFNLRERAAALLEAREVSHLSLVAHLREKVAEVRRWDER